jgi:hypothetical protein
MASRNTHQSRLKSRGIPVPRVGRHREGWGEAFRRAPISDEVEVRMFAAVENEFDREEWRWPDAEGGA